MGPSTQDDVGSQESIGADVDRDVDGLAEPMIG